MDVLPRSVDKRQNASEHGRIAVRIKGAFRDVRKTELCDGVLRALLGPFVQRRNAVACKNQVAQR